MYCVIQEIERKTEGTGQPKELKVYTFSINGETIYGYQYSEERFERPIKKAYKISIHESYRENGKVKKKQYSITTMGYYDIYEFALEDCVLSSKITNLADKLGITENDIYNLVYEKLEPLYNKIEKEFEQTEEYKTRKKHKEILTKYREAEREFQRKYNSLDFNKCYDIFLNLRNKDKLDQIKRQYEENYEYQRKSQEQQYKRYYEQYSNYDNSSSYQADNNSNYNDDDKKLLKKIYKKLAIEFHPDKNNGSDESKRAMQIINNLKEQWGI